MPQQTKIFRVFVSSTFTDMKEERRILQRDVFPKLEKFCEEKGARFQGVDLRWGVNEELQLDQKTLQTCFNEIDRCQKISPKPNFLILLGDKYGWQPIPEEIPGNEMESIKKLLSKSELNFLIKEKDEDPGWYRFDTNAIPQEYVLQPRGELKKYEDWEPVEKKIRNILRNAVTTLKFPDDQRSKYFDSATHQEILRGAVSPTEDIGDPKEHVYAFIRTTEGLPGEISAKDYIELTDNKPDAYCAKQLSNLKNDLKKKLEDHYIPYEGKWEKDHVKMNDPKWFADEIYSKLESIIDLQIKETKVADEIEQEVKLHTEFKQRLTRHFHGRIKPLELISEYLKNKSEKRIMALIGDSGSGKSSVMAKAINLYIGEDKKKEALTFYRFLGTSSSSSSIISLLQSVCGQIAKHLDTSLEELAGEGRKESLHDLYTMSEIFRKCLALAQPDSPIVIFLDALDQLSDSDNAKTLSWLPSELPENCRLVVSSLPELKPDLRKSYMETLNVLTKEEAREILEQWFHSNQRTLTEKQYQVILGKFNGLPLHLKLAFENAKEWHDYDNDMDIKEDVPLSINSFFDSLKKKHNEEFIEHAICYLLSGRYQGLTENEILEILVFDKEFWENIFLEKITHKDHKQELVDMKKALEEPETGPKVSMKIPIVVWSRLFLDLEPFLTERDADGVPIITFFHKQFNEVLRERYKLPKPNFKN